MSKDARRKQSASISMPVRVTPELDDLITSTAAAVKLSKSDTIRLSLERGLSILKRQLAEAA